MSLLLGAIADDFTGATDLANTLVNQGMRATLVIGVPDEATQIGDAEAVIVALKSRTEAVEAAVSDSVKALQWLQGRGAEQFFFKYCSTFDSTAEGNIGPVADALMDVLEADFAFVCPAFPANGRSVYQGYLFVNEVLLSESSMKDHPLTPMRDASLPRLMNAQSRRHCGLITLQQVRSGVDAILKEVDLLKAKGFSYAVIDAVTNEDLAIVGEAAADHVLVTGGSGAALGLPTNFRSRGLLAPQQATEIAPLQGRQLVLAGSCSAATRAQIEAVQPIWPHRKIDVDAIAAGVDVSAELVQWASNQDSATPVLIYASADPAEVVAIQNRHGIDQAGAMVERVMGELAQGLVAQGFTRLFVAGGETSGAVVGALDVGTLRIGPEIAPGVPWTEAFCGGRVALALKSGNFGGADFFRRAFEVLK